MAAVASLAVPAISTSATTEYFDVLNEIGAKTGIVKARNHVHRDGDWHRAVHVWIYAQSTHRLLIQKRAECKESWPNLWDISAAGHVTAGDQSLETAQRETQEELGVDVPVEAIEPLFSMQSAFNTNDDTFVNNEFIDVYLVTIKHEVPVDSFTLQQSEVASIRQVPAVLSRHSIVIVVQMYIGTEDLEKAFTSNDRAFVCPDASSEYMQIFKILHSRRTVPHGSLKTALGQIGMVQVEYICWQA
ncbi:TPA: hypothetical protein ACH3X1_004587 [Trebouxia sp. C0004]